MPDATAYPKYGERFQLGQAGQNVDVPYLVKDAADRQAAAAAIVAVAPATVVGYARTEIVYIPDPENPGTYITAETNIAPTLFLLDVSCDEMAVPSTGLWEGTARYGLPQSTQRSTGESTFQFETGGGSQHITQSLKTISKTAANAQPTPPNFGGAIGVSGDGEAAGVDIITPVFKFSVTVYASKDFVNQTWLGVLYASVGKVNSTDIRVTINGFPMLFAAGELLLEGVSGGIRGNQDFEITFRLAASPNVADVCADWDSSVKPASAVPKKGWEYAWVSYLPDVDTTAAAIVRKPLAIYIEQVYKYVDFTGLNIP